MKDNMQTIERIMAMLAKINREHNQELIHLSLHADGSGSIKGVPMAIDGKRTVVFSWDEPADLDRFIAEEA